MNRVKTVFNRIQNKISKNNCIVKLSVDASASMRIGDGGGHMKDMSMAGLALPRAVSYLKYMQVRAWRLPGR